MSKEFETVYNMLKAVKDECESRTPVDVDEDDFSYECKKACDECPYGEGYDGECKFVGIGMTIPTTWEKV